MAVDPVTLEVGRIVQLSNQRGDPTARLIIADDLVTLRKRCDELTRKYHALYAEWQRDGLREAVLLAFHRTACSRSVCHCQPFIDLAIPAAAVELTAERREGEKK